MTVRARECAGGGLYGVEEVFGGQYGVEEVFGYSHMLGMAYCMVSRKCLGTHVLYVRHTVCHISLLCNNEFGNLTETEGAFTAF